MTMPEPSGQGVRALACGVLIILAIGGAALFLALHPLP
jgi:hypothetical protein